MDKEVAVYRGVKDAWRGNQTVNHYFNIIPKRSSGLAFSGFTVNPICLPLSLSGRKGVDFCRGTICGSDGNMD